MVIFYLWVNFDVAVMIIRKMIQSQEKMVLEGLSHAKWFWRARQMTNGLRGLVTGKMVLKGLPPEKWFQRACNKKNGSRGTVTGKIQYTSPRTYVFEPIRTYGTFDLALTENVTETTKVR